MGHGKNVGVTRIKHTLKKRPKAIDPKEEKWLQEFEKELRERKEYCERRIKEEAPLSALVAYVELDLLKEILGEEEKKSKCKNTKEGYAKILRG